MQSKQLGGNAMARENTAQSEDRNKEAHTPTGWMTDREVAAYARVSRNRVWAWARNGNLPKPTKLGPNTSRWHIDDIKQWAKERREEAA